MLLRQGLEVVILKSWNLGDRRADRSQPGCLEEIPIREERPRDARGQGREPEPRKAGSLFPISAQTLPTPNCSESQASSSRSSLYTPISADPGPPNHMLQALCTSSRFLLLVLVYTYLSHAWNSVLPQVLLRTYCMPGTVPKEGRKPGDYILVEKANHINLQTSRTVVQRW